MSRATTLYDDAVRVLTSWTATSAEAETARRETVALLHDGPVAMTRAHRPGHLTASTLILSEDRRVLLCLHGRMNLWMQVGGRSPRRWVASGDADGRSRPTRRATARCSPVRRSP